jgi:uncharacterized protein (TIGR02285 family)
MKKLIIGVAIIFITSTTVAQETIEWYYRHYPPYSIAEGRLQGQGYGDESHRIVQGQLSEYNHKITIMSLDRFLENARASILSCSSTFLKTPEREQVLHYSIPAEVNLPHKLFFKEKNFSKFKPYITEGKISLDAVRLDPQLKLGIEDKRSYGKEKNRIIKKYREDQVYKRNMANFAGLIDMLELDRFDYIIEYARNIAYAYEESPMKISKLYGIDIIEGYELLKAHYVCTKSEQGLAVINKINAILKSEIPKDRYRRRAERWYKEDVQDYRKAYDELLLKPLKNGEQ